MTEWKIGLDREVLDALPPPTGARVGSADRIAGMLLGLAVGDALANTSEGEAPARRRARRGEITHYLPNRHAGGRSVGLPSDDTQLAFWLLEHLLEHGRVVPDRLAAAFADGRRIFGLGHTVGAFLQAYQAGAPWWEAAQPSAGNGAVMRIPPVVLPHLRDPSAALWQDAILGGAVTHDDRSSIGACVAMAGILLDVLGMTAPPPPRWWVDRYVALARPVEGERGLEPRFGDLEFTGPIWRFVDTLVRDAVTRDETVLAAAERWGSGAYLLETMPCVVLVLARHGHDPEQAIVRAVNDTKDNDTVAAIVGAAVGALHGKAALPRRWLEGLLGRTRDDDDGRVFALVEEACRRWG